MKTWRGIVWTGAAVLFLAAVLVPPAPAQDKAAVSGANALGYVRVLTGERFQSRMAGTEGGRLAGEWIADQFKAWGLEPAGTNGYFQEFKKAVFHVDAASLSIAVGPGSRTFAPDEEWRIAQYSGSATVRGELVFAGYGIVSEKAGWNDFAGLDLKGKIVLFIGYGAPSFMAAQYGPEMMPEAKIAKAYELGARAVLVMEAPVDVLTGFGRYPFPAGIMLQPANYRADVAVAGLNADAVKAVFRDSGMDLYSRVQKMEQTKKPGSMPLGVQAEINVKTTYRPEAAPRNVLAKITGSDRDLRNEYVIIGAHYDGLGNQPDGRLNPGADDNASGTAVVMEVARAMKAGKARPKRTVVFALWDGEEEGLWGSVYYSQHPVFPMNKTVANLNLDMVGNGDGRLQCRGVYYGSGVWELLKKSLPADILKDVTGTRGGPGGSDHTPFLANGVPGFFIQTTGAHYGRHDAGDKFDLVDPALLEKSGNFVKAATAVLADVKEINREPSARETNILRSSTLVDLTPRDAAALLKEAEGVEYLDLDFALVGVPGAAPLEIVKGLVDTAAAVQASKKALLYQPPTGFNMQRYGDRVGVLPGVTNLSALGGQDTLLKVLGKSGLGFIVVRDADFARGEDEVRRMVAAANAAGVLVIARTAQPANTDKIVEWSVRPGLLVGGAPAADLLAKMQPKRWRLAVEWKAGMTPEEYAAVYQKAAKDMGPMMILIQAEKYGLKGFAPSFVKLVSLTAPKELSEQQMMSGGLDELGQAFIILLMELR